MTYPREYTTKCLCWCTPGQFSDPRYIQGRIGSPAPEIIDSPPYKDIDFKTYIDDDDNLIYMNDTNPLESRMNYISGIPRRTDGHLYGPIDILLKEDTFYGLNNDYVLDSCRCDKFLFIEFEFEREIEGSPNPNDVKIIGILSGNFTHIQNYLDNQEIVFKRSAIINLLITRNGHSGCGTNLITTYLKMLKHLEVNVCFLESVPDAFYFYLKYDFCSIGYYYQEKYGDVDKKQLFAIDLNAINLDSISKNPPSMQRFASNNKSRKRKMNVVEDPQLPLIRIGIRPKLLEESTYYRQYRNYLIDIEKLQPLDEWEVLTTCLMANSPKLKGRFSSSAVRINRNHSAKITIPKLKKGKTNMSSIVNPMSTQQIEIFRPPNGAVQPSVVVNSIHNGARSNNGNRPRSWSSWLRSFKSPFSWVQ